MSLLISDPGVDFSADIMAWVRVRRPVDLYWCPHCGYKLAHRVARDDLISYCWGECLDIYEEPIPLTFIRGIGKGAPGNEMPF